MTCNKYELDIKTLKQEIEGLRGEGESKLKALEAATQTRAQLEAQVASLHDKYAQLESEKSDMLSEIYPTGLYLSSHAPITTDDEQKSCCAAIIRGSA